MKKNSFLKSVSAAIRGVVYAFGRERNYRIEVFCAFIFIAVLAFLGASLSDYIIAFFIITMILVAELTNTALERIVDILKPQKHPYARIIKDLSAAVVITAAIGGSLISLMIMVPLMMRMIG